MLEAKQWYGQKVELYCHISQKSRDLFGLWDDIYLHMQHGIRFVQVCGSDWSAHIQKMEASAFLPVFNGVGILTGWRKLKDEGWSCRLAVVREGKLVEIDNDDWETALGTI